MRSTSGALVSIAYHGPGEWPLDPRESAAPPYNPPMPGRILLADDHEPTLHGLERLCLEAGHEVWTASNGVDALELARLHGPDVALLKD